MEDARITELIRLRDESAIEALSAKYGEQLTRIALRVTGDARTAEECVNSAYFRLWSLGGQLRSGSLFALLAKIVRGEAIDRLRAEGAGKRSAATVELTRELEECIPGSETVEGALEANELSRLIRAFVEALPREKQLIFVRRYWYFDPIAEIAQSMGLTQSKVKTELLRTRKKLKQYLERNGHTV